MKMTLEAEIQQMFSRVERERWELNLYQSDLAVPFLKANPFSALFVDVGLGKSVSCLTMLSDLLLTFEHEGKVLIVGPKRVATETWPTEIGLWQHTAWMRHKVLFIGDDDPRVRAVPAAGRTQMKNKLRIEAAHSPQDIHIVSVDWLEWLCEYWGDKWPYRTVIIDESSSFKDHSSKRFKALAKIRCTVRKGQPLITRLHLLTATPAAESYIGLFPQIFLLDKGERLGINITAFRRSHFDENAYTHKWVLRDGHEDLILDKIKDICLVLKARDHLNLAEPTVRYRQVHLDERQTTLYKTMEKDFIVQLDDGTEIEAETAAALSQKLLQLSSGVLYEAVESVDPNTSAIKKSRKVHEIHDHKIEELKQIVEELQGLPVLVAYHHKSSLERLQKHFPKAVVMDEKGACVDRWNKGKIPMLLMHPQSGGHGLNLQKGPGHHLVWFDLVWSLELNIQMNGRLARQGQKNPVIIWMLMTVGTIDELVAKAIRAKEDGQDKFFAKLKRRIAKFRAQKMKDAADAAEIAINTARNRAEEFDVSDL